MDYKFSTLSILIICLVIGQVASSHLFQMEDIKSIAMAERDAKKMMKKSSFSFKQMTKEVGTIEKKMHHILRKLKKNGHLTVAKEATALKKLVEHTAKQEKYKLTSEVNMAAQQIDKQVQQQEKQADRYIYAEARKVNNTAQLANAAVKQVGVAGSALIHAANMEANKLKKHISHSIKKAENKTESEANQAKQAIHNAVAQEITNAKDKVKAMIVKEEVQAISGISKETADIRKEVSKTMHKLKSPLKAELKKMAPQMMKYATDLKLAAAEARIIARKAKHDAQTIKAQASHLNQITHKIQQLQATMLDEAHKLDRFSNQVNRKANRADREAQRVINAVKMVQEKETPVKKTFAKKHTKVIPK